VRGTFSDGIVVAEDGVAGVAEAWLSFDEILKLGGGGSFVAALADPGRTIGLESEILDLFAYPLCHRKHLSAFSA